MIKQRFFLPQYAPVTVSNIKRAKAGGHKGALKQIITSHVDIEVQFVQRFFTDICGVQVCFAVASTVVSMNCSYYTVSMSIKP